MSLRALLQPFLARLRRTEFGTKIKDSAGKLRDTGVQDAVDEVSAMFSDEPIDLTEPLVLRNKMRGPAIVIINEGSSSDGTFIQIINNQTVVNLSVVNNEFVVTNITNNITNTTEVAGFSGSVTYVKSSTVSVSGCTVTITDVTGVMTFENGLLKSVT